MDQIVGRLARRHSTAAVLFHHAFAQRLGLGPTDHKCLDLLRERGPMTGSELAAITGLTTGAVTGVVARLERAGYLRREPDRHDRRMQILYPAEGRMKNIHVLFEPMRKEVAEILQDFDLHQLAAIAAFLDRSTEAIHRHVPLLRAYRHAAPSQTRAIHGKRAKRKASGTTNRPPVRPRLRNAK